MASTIKVTNIDTPDGTGNITVDRPLSGSGASLTSLPAGNLTGTVADARFPATLPAVSGANLTNLPASGDRRNFIIDGDFTQWPEGTSRTRATGKYASALFEYNGHTTANWNANRSTTVPTVAESSYQSKYSLELDVTTADASPSNASYYEYFYHITGTDYSSLHGQEVTLSFWHRHTVTGTYCIHFQNSAGNRHYLAEYTQTTTNTWEKASITLTLDTSGTWLFDDTGIGLTITFVLEAGSDHHGTAGAWSGTSKKSTANQVNGLSSVSNYMYFSQVQLTLGSTAPTFILLPMSIVEQQMGWYVQKSGSNGQNITAGTTDGPVQWLTEDTDRTDPVNVTLYSEPMRIDATWSFADIGGTAGKVSYFVGSPWGYNNNKTITVDRQGKRGLGRVYSDASDTGKRGMAFQFLKDARH